ncbi:DUF2637 domain-containing protein, partial [Streptomyces violaceusniger]|uniref:DUF2637 domain-containing protein n=1 Tax=Streptomyces violaceusniger TaxID=68280 RepID=UPI003437774B
AVGRIADITADRHMESVRITRWLLAPVPTFRLWRRMKLWELRSYDEVIRLEQDRLVYQARLRARYGRAWRRKAPVESLMPLRLARYGVPLSDTAPAGLAAAGLEPSAVSPTALPPGRTDAADANGTTNAAAGPNGPGDVASPQEQLQPQEQQIPDQAAQPEQQPRQHPQPSQQTVPVQTPNQVPNDVPREVIYYTAFRQFLAERNHYPSAYQFGQLLRETYGVTDLSNSELAAYIDDIKGRDTPAPEQARTDGEEAGGVADVSAMTDTTVTDGRTVLTDLTAPADPVYTETGSVPQEAAQEPVTAPVAGEEMTDGRSDGGRSHAKQPTVTTAASQSAMAGTATSPGSAAVTPWVPKQQDQEPELDPEEQRIQTVAQWIAEAEAKGETLSGAEVARRLEVSPRTGQRVLRKGQAYRTEQQRQQSRHLRSVSS